MSEKHDIKVRLLSLAQCLPKKVCVPEKCIIFIPNEIFPDHNPRGEGALALYASFARSIFKRHPSARFEQHRTVNGEELVVLKDHVPRLLDIMKVLAKTAGYTDEQIAQIQPEQYKQYEQPTTTAQTLHDKPAFTAEEMADDPKNPWYHPRSS